jgi:hypothetical protein
LVSGADMNLKSMASRVTASTPSSNQRKTKYPQLGHGKLRLAASVATINAVDCGEYYISLRGS